MSREQNLTPMEWAKGAVDKHGWGPALKIALRHVIAGPEFFTPIVEYIKRKAPHGALVEVLGEQ